MQFSASTGAPLTLTSNTREFESSVRFAQPQSFTLRSILCTHCVLFYARSSYISKYIAESVLETITCTSLIMVAFLGEAKISNFHNLCSYRKLSLKFHPAKNESAGTEEKFSEVAEAYDILSHSEL